MASRCLKSLDEFTGGEQNVGAIECLLLRKNNRSRRITFNKTQNMNLTPEQISENWIKLNNFIETYIKEPRKQELIKFYKQYEDRLILMPASTKISYHNCFPGGYIDHVNRVIEGALGMFLVWEKMGVEVNFTLEELVFSAMNHDLGKMGTKDQEAYLPNSSQWHKDNRGELYEFNTKIAFMSVPDRSLYLLTQHGINFSENEFLAIKLHDGIYEEANKPYLMSYSPEAKPRTSLVHIIHHADLMASRIEFEKEYMPKFYSDKPLKEPKKTKESSLANSLKIMGSSTNVNKSFQNILNNI